MSVTVNLNMYVPDPETVAEVEAADAFEMETDGPPILVQRYELMLPSSVADPERLIEDVEEYDLSEPAFAVGR